MGRRGRGGGGGGGGHGAHPVSRNHPCPYCEQRFLYPSSVKRHTESVHWGLRPYRCAVTAGGRGGCDATFGTPDHLARHIRTVHVAGQRFACAACGAEFTRRDHLSRHVARVHDGEGSYSGG